MAEVGSVTAVTVFRYRPIDLAPLRLYSRCEDNALGIRIELGYICSAILKMFTVVAIYNGQAFVLHRFYGIFQVNARTHTTIIVGWDS